MAVDVVTEEVARNLEEAAEVTRKITAYPAGFFFAGVIVGGAVGFYYGYKLTKAKIRAEAFKEAEAEIAKMRDHYQQKTMAAQAQAKPPVENLIEEKGYAPPPVEHMDQQGSMSTTSQGAEGTVTTRDWDWEIEMARRKPDHPYVIHQNEFNEKDNPYSQVAYTYYAVDDVLVDEDNRPLPHGDLIVGQDNLRWGHGTDSEDVVFVRNERLSLEMEICRTHSSYEEEVLGFERDGNESG